MSMYCTVPFIYKSRKCELIAVTGSRLVAAWGVRRGHGREGSQWHKLLEVTGSVIMLAVVVASPLHNLPQVTKLCASKACGLLYINYAQESI